MFDVVSFKRGEKSKKERCKIPRDFTKVVFWRAVLVTEDVMKTFAKSDPFFKVVLIYSLMHPNHFVKDWSF